MIILHLDNIASSHPVGGDKDIVGTLDADEVLHGSRRPGTAGSIERGAGRLLCLTGETAPYTLLPVSPIRPQCVLQDTLLHSQAVPSEYLGASAMSLYF